MKNLPFGEYMTHLEYYDDQTLVKIVYLIIKNDDKYLLLTDSLDKFNDVDKMPDYIQKDWLKYNSKEITEIDLNRLKDKLKRWTSRGLMDPTSQVYEDHMEKLNIIKNIQREVKIKNLLS
jgi:hypothetical protein